MEYRDWIITLATLLAPLVAVQISRYLEDRKSIRAERLRLFHTLMATRASSLDHRHVEALNMIDVIFSGSSKGEKRIRESWKAYLDVLSDKTLSPEVWPSKRLDHMVELLFQMAAFLGYDFDKTHIKNQAYFPEGYGRFEEDQATIRKAIVEVLTSGRPLPIWVCGTSTPEPPSKQAVSPIMETALEIKNGLGEEA
jgi:hypothetical protein